MQLEMKSNAKNTWFKIFILFIFLFICFSAAYSQESQNTKELDEAIANARNAKYEQAIPILKKYVEVKGLDDFNTLSANVYLNWSYLATKNEVLDVGKINALTDAYIAKYGILKTDTSKSADEATLLYYNGVINNKVRNTKKMVLYFSLINDYYTQNELSPDPFYANVLVILTNGYYTLKDYKSASEIGKVAWEVNLKLFGKANNTSLNILDLLASSNENIGKTGKATEYLENRAIIGKEILGEKNPDYLLRLNVLAEDYIFIGQYQKALNILLKAVELGKNSLGEKNIDYLTFLNNLSSVYSKLGVYTKALEINKKVVELRKEVLGEKDPIYLSSLNSLANGYAYFGDYQKALEINLKVVKLRKEVFGEKDPDYIMSLADLAKTYSDNGDYLKALEIKMKVVELRKEVLGEKNKDFLVSLANLGVAYSRLGEGQKALWSKATKLNTI